MNAEEKLNTITAWLNENYSQDSENYNTFSGAKPEVIRLDDETAISFWGCGAIVCIGSLLYFIEEDDGFWWIEKDMTQEEMKTEWGIVYRYRGGNYRFTLYVYNDDMKTMYLSGVRVNPTARKKGIGNDILVTAENESKKYGADNIFLLVSKSSWVHDWYKRYGFADFMNDKYKDYVWMQKQIN